MFLAFGLSEFLKTAAESPIAENQIKMSTCVTILNECAMLKYCGVRID